MKQKWVYWLSSGVLLLSIFLIISISTAGTLNSYGVESDNPYVVSRFVQDGKTIDMVIVSGRPPEFYRAPAAVIPETSFSAGTNSLSNVPAFDWSYGCAATSTVS